MAEKRVPTTTKVQGMIDNLQWLVPVLDKDLSTPPGTPAVGDRYIVGPTATGDWVGQEDNIAEWNGTTWDFTAAALGMSVLVIDEVDIYTFDATDWLVPYGEGAGDMLKSVYDTGGVDGIVDKAESIDDGTNTATAADIADAVTKKHDHANKTTLDAIEEAFTTALKTAYDNAVSLAHSHSNMSILDLIEEALTTALKTQYDKAYSSRALYDAATDEIVFTDPDAYT